MPKVVIKDVYGIPDGEYPLDMTFTHRDFHTIKQVAGVRANEVQDALAGGDLDIVVALAEIALNRSRVEHSVDQLWEAVAGSLTLDVSDMEDELIEDPSRPDSPDSERSDSGAATSGDTESWPGTSSQDGSGTPLLDSTSDQLTSTT